MSNHRVDFRDFRASSTARLAAAALCGLSALTLTGCPAEEDVSEADLTALIVRLVEQQLDDATQEAVAAATAARDDADDQSQRTDAVTTTINGANGLAGAQGAAGPVGPAGPQGPVGPAGSAANVTQGKGVWVNNGHVSLDPFFTDALYKRTFTGGLTETAAVVSLDQAFTDALYRLNFGAGLTRVGNQVDLDLTFLDTRFALTFGPGFTRTGNTVAIDNSFFDARYAMTYGAGLRRAGNLIDIDTNFTDGLYKREFGFGLIENAGVVSVDMAVTGDAHSLDSANGQIVDALFVANGGNVGIGSTTPGAALTVHDGEIRVQNAAGEPKVQLFDSAIGGGGQITIRNSQGDIHVSAGGQFGDPTRGFVAVGDSDNEQKVAMFVDAQGRGTIAAEVKNFRIADPTDPAREIWYASLEGPEVGAYIRGTARLLNGEAVVEFPEHFRAIASPQGMTVSLTPLSADSRGLAVTEKGAARLVIRELGQGRGSYEFDYVVHVVRRGHEDYQPVRPAQSISATPR